MTRQPVNCSLLIEQASTPFVIYHQQLGCFRSDWHQHAWGQLVYAEKGCIHLHTEGRTVLLPGGYGVWIPADTNHEIWSDSPHLHMRALCFPLAPFAESRNQLLSIFPVSTLLGEMIRYTEKWSQETEDTSPVTTFLRAIETVLPGELEKAISVYLPSTTHEKLGPILACVQQRLSQPVSLQELAREFGLSGRTLTRLFSQQLGMSFSSYGKIARIMKALELIETGTHNVSELASLVGYESLSTFSNNFLEICGQRPLHFIHEKKR